MRLLARWRRTGREAGYVAILVSILVPTVFLGLAATGVDTARWYLEGERVQLAADAAALAGVPYLPQDMANATARARLVAARNGYDDADANVEVRVEQGVRTSQLRVTITSTIPNQFGQLIGVPRANIARTAVADFTGPAPMGSPCNAFGEEPSAGSGGASSGTSSGSALGTSPPGNCSRRPQLWATVEGPETGKVQGDRYGTKQCESSGVDGCSGSTNSEYTERGYFWLIKVRPNMVNQSINLQLYDPAFVSSGQFCEALPDYGAAGMQDDMNPYAATDGRLRYSDPSTVSSAIRPGTGTRPSFCTGDSFPGSGSGASPKRPMTTTFAVRQQTDTQDPMRAPVQNDTSGQPCVKQYGARTTVPTADSLRDDRAGYIAPLAEVFHNWVSLCTFTPTREGDYYLQVRTNKRYSFSGTELTRSVPSGSVASVVGDSGDSSLYGEGSNSFAIRAVVPSGKQREVAVSGWDRMPMFVNSEAATTKFNLIRILPGAAGQFISFDFFDAGDAAGTATVKVSLPADARTPAGTMIATPFPGGCTSTGGSAGTGQNLPNCTATLTQSGGVSRNNGKIQTINIPIPADYSCDATVYSNCWYQVEVSFASGSVNDVTTWDAEIVGDPVRLIE